MASLIEEGNGRRRIEVFDAAGDRKRIKLGKIDKATALKVKGKIEDLVTAQVTGHAADQETQRWAIRLDEGLYHKLARAGLVAPRESLRLGPWLEKYLSERTDLKPESLRKLQQTKDKLLVFFPADAVLQKITAAQASEWRASMLKEIQEATVKIHCGNAKTIFNEAARRKIVAENPFLHLASGPTPAINERYVTPEEAAKIIEHCADIRFKLIFGLARYAGLRTPSESFDLRWKNIDFGRGRMNVRSKKTERYHGHERRTVPISPPLMKILERAYAAAAPGEERIIAMKHTGFVPTRMNELIMGAGVEPWEDLFQTLRRSCEIEWAMRYPQFAVSKWIGHSITVSGRHYANLIPDELFDAAAGVAQNQAQKPIETVRNLAKVSSDESRSVLDISRCLQEFLTISGGGELGDEGLEPPTETHISAAGERIFGEGAQNQAHSDGQVTEAQWGAVWGVLTPAERGRVIRFAICLRISP